MAKIFIYHLPSVFEQLTCEYAAKFLSANEREQAATIQAHNRLKEFIAGRYFLRHQIAKTLNTEPTTVSFTKTEQGKPYMLGNPLYFNVSHSGDYLAIGLDPSHALGVDIEQVSKPRKNLVAVARRYFTDDEIQRIESANTEQQTQLFYQAWTKKEAAFKATGLGISAGLNSFNALGQEKHQHITLPITHTLARKNQEDSTAEQSTQSLWLDTWMLNGKCSVETLHLSIALYAEQQPAPTAIDWPTITEFM